jgi:hypothetical protein
MVRISVTNHVVDKYRERVKDALRAQRSAREIKERIIGALANSRAYYDFVQLISEGFSPKARIDVRFSDSEDLLYCLVVGKRRGHGRDAAVITLE